MKIWKRSRHCLVGLLLFLGGWCHSASIRANDEPKYSTNATSTDRNTIVRQVENMERKRTAIAPDVKPA
jgi:hypothetical protein